MNQEEYKVRRIPENYENGIHLAGFSFKPVFLIEGGILAVIAIGISFLIMRYFGLEDMGQMIGVALVFAGAGLFMGIKGINDEPLTTYLRHLAEYKRGRRIAYYNPRIKEEAKSLMMEEKDRTAREALPREKIMAIFNKYRSAIDKKQHEKAMDFEDANSFDPRLMYFEDDIGILKRPKEFYSDKEKRKINKKKKKMKDFMEGING